MHRVTFLLDDGKPVASPRPVDGRVTVDNYSGESVLVFTHPVFGRNKIRALHGYTVVERSHGRRVVDGMEYSMEGGMVLQRWVVESVPAEIPPKYPN